MESEAFRWRLLASYADGYFCVLGLDKCRDEEYDLKRAVEKCAHLHQTVAKYGYVAALRGYTLGGEKWCDILSMIHPDMCDILERDEWRRQVHEPLWTACQGLRELGVWRGGGGSGVHSG